MMTELTTETELRFNVKTISTENMINMLEEDGWKQESMHFSENKISANAMASMLKIQVGKKTKSQNKKKSNYDAVVSHIALSIN